MDNKKESKPLLAKINSKYIYNIIFDYIKDTKFKLKFFINSKLFQKLSNIALIDYQEQYINKFNLNPNDYLSNSNKNNFFSFDENNKDYLKQNLEEKLSKYKIDINLYKTYIVNYYKKCFNNYQKNQRKIQDEDYKINIYSPFFDCLSKSDIFEYFNIEIPIDYIKENKCENDYISVFDKLNKQNLNYSSLYYYFEDINDINEFKININFSQIKRLKLEQKYKNKFGINEVENNNKKKEKEEQNIFFLNFLSYKNFENNLLYLNFIINENNYKIDSNLFSNINNFKLLEELKLDNFDFDQTFILNLYNLKFLSITYCKNITFSENTFLNLKELNLIKNKIEKPKSLLKLPKLEKLSLENKKSNNNDITTDYNSIIDFESIRKLNSLKIDVNSLNYINDISCETIDILDSSRDLEKEKEMVKKIILMEGKSVSFYLNEINADDISNIKEDNTSVTDLTICLGDNCYSCMNLLDKFKNITNLKIREYMHENLFNCCCQHKRPLPISKIRIMENPNSKINDISIEINNNIEFFCAPYENLISIDFLINGKIKLKDTYNVFVNSIPFFSNNCNIIFKSLIKFQFFFKDQIDFRILENIYNNVDKMPNLRHFSFLCYSVKNNEDFYKKFIKKLLLMKLDLVILKIDKYSCYSEAPCYSKEELMEICGTGNICDLNNVIISKINEYKTN